MSKTLRLEGEANILLETLLNIISATTTDPLYHISEIVQNELDANASEINITFFRKSSKKGGIKKIVIGGNGFGFLESFEHYRKHIGDSIKKYSNEYIARTAKGLSRGQFCIGIQGFRAVCDELHIVNKTKKGISPKSSKEGKQIDDPDFDKMFKNRNLILKSDRLNVKIKEEGDFSDHRDGYGVTCTLINPMTIKSKNLVKYLAQNKRSELLANKKLKIVVKDGSFTETVKPIEFTGECLKFEQAHPKEKKSYKYRGFGKVEATLYFHEAKPGSKIRLDVKGEPIFNDITKLQEFDRPPWNTDFVEGIIEYPHLEKSPLRKGVKPDKIFWPAFLEIMDELSKKVEEKVKECEEKSNAKRDEKLMKKLEKVMGEVKRELDFQTWFNRSTDKPPELGPLDHIKVFPEVANIPAFTTRCVHVRAYDRENNPLRGCGTKLISTHPEHIVPQ